MGQGAGMIGQGADALGTAQGMYGQGTGLVGQGSGLYGLGTQMTGQAANMFAPGAAQQFYNPYEDRVIDDTLERMRKTSAQQDIAGRAQDISSGAFGGSRGRLLAGERQAESERGILQALSGIRSQGYQQAQQAAQTAGQGIGTLAGQLGQFGQGLGTLGGQLGQFGQGLTSTGGQYGQLGTQIGQLGTGVAGLGQQKSGELSNYANLLNALGTQGQTTQQSGLSRLYQAAQQRAGEPWDRAMRGMNVLGGFRPGELIGGYETKVMQPQTYQQPTSAGSTMQGIGSLLGFGKTIADIYNIFNPTDAATGGFMEKPRDYNAGGIVSGIVPINMATGGDAELQNELDKLEPSVREKVVNYMKENPWARKAAVVGSVALMFAPIPGARMAAGARLAPGLTRGARTAWSKLRGQGRQVKSKGGKWWDVDSSQGKAILNANKNAPMRVTGDPQSIALRTAKFFGKRPVRTLLGGTLGLSLLGGEEEEEKTLDPAATDEWLELQKEELAKAKTKKEREKIIDDIVTTTSRLGEMMNAPGTRQVTLADAANIFSEERRDLPRSEAMQAAQEMADETGMSLKDIIELTALQPGLEGRVESQEQLAQRIMNVGLSQYGANMEGHPDVQKYVAEGMSAAEAAAKVKLEIMRTLRGLDYGTLQSYADQLGKEVIELNASE